MVRLARFVSAALLLTGFSTVFASNPARSLSSFPLTFEANRGQAPAQYSYLLRRDGITTFFSRNEVDFSLPGTPIDRNRVRLEFLSTERAATPVAQDLLRGQSNYLLGSDSSRWINNIPNYARLNYQNIYPGISLVFYGTRNELEHDFTIAAGADPSFIKFRISGASNVDLSLDGNLEIHVGTDTLIFKKPLAYQQSDKGRDPIKAAFLLAKNGTVGFKLGPYDSHRPLIIDPVFSFSTYFDGNNADEITAVTTDSAGNIYLTGYTASADFPSENGVQPQMGCASDSCQNAFIAKLDPTGTTLLFSTYLGGSIQDQTAAIALDSKGNVIVTGVSESADFPHAGNVAPLSCRTNQYCYFVASIKPGGSALNYSGLIGGSQGTYSNGNNGRLAVDASGNAYLAGVTDDPTFQITANTLSSTVPGYPYDNLFVLKVDATGNLLYSTIIPGNAAQNPSTLNNLFIPAGIAVDSSGEATVSGTAYQGLPTTSGVVSPTFPNNPNVQNATAGFVLQLNASASAINYATYVPGTDFIGGMAVDSSGDVYVTGNTSESSLPVSAGAYQKSLIPGPNCTCNAGFVLKMNPQGTAIAAASYLSGTPSQGNSGTSFMAIALDTKSDVFLGGFTGSTDFPLQNPISSEWEYTYTAWEMVLAEMSPDFSSVTFGSFLSSTDGVYPGSSFSALALDPSDNLVVAGTTDVSDFPTTAGSFQAHPPASVTNAGYTHTFISKINMGTAAPSFCPAAWSISFGPVLAKSSADQTLNIKNCGNAPLDFTSLSSTVSSITATQSCGSVAPGAVCPATLTFTPVNDAAVSGTITFADNAVISPQTISVSGQGQAPDLEPGANPLTFGHLFVGTQGPSTPLFIFNYGNEPLTISSISISGNAFSMTENDCIGTWQDGSLCVVDVVFSPQSGGTLSGSLTIVSNDPVHPQLVVSLMGTGDATYATPTVTSTDTSPGLPQQTVQIDNGPLTLDVNGSNFYPASVVQVNGVAQQTTFGTNSLLRVTVSPSSLSALGEVPLTVVNPSPGGGTSGSITLTPYQVLPLNASSLISVPSKGLLYAAIPASQSSNPNTVIPIDPATGILGTPIPVGNNPTLMAASSDGSYLYVALTTDQTVQRINLQTNAVDRTFPYSPNPFCTGCSILPETDLQAVPGSPQEAVLAQGAMISLYNDSGLVNYVPQTYATSLNPPLTSFAFAGNPLTIYGLPFSYAKNFFQTIQIGSAGLSYTPVTGPNLGGNNTTGNQVISDGTLLYTSAGQVWNPATQTEVGTFPESTYNNTSYPNLGSIAVDSNLKQIYAIGEQNYGTDSSATVLSVYGMQSLALQASLGFPQYPVPELSDLVRWGANGLAFILPSAGVCLLESNTIAQQQPYPAPSLTSVSPSSAIAGSSSFTLTLNGTQFVPASTVNWNGTPLSTMYVSSTQLTAIVPAADLTSAGMAQVTVTTPAPGGGSSSALSFEISVGMPNAEFSVTSLDFGSVAQGSASAAQSLTLTNSGSATLSITSVAASGDFSETNSCTGGLAANATCQISILFAPTATGSRTGVLIVTDNAGTSPQTITLTGTGVADLTIGSASGSSTSATVTSGGTATYNLSLTSAPGFSGTATLTCSGAPQNAACSINPTSLNVNPGGSASFSVSVTTASQTATLLENSTFRFGGFGLGSLLILPLFFRSRRRAWVASLWLGALFLMVSGCGGGGSGTAQSGAPSTVVTPAGTYTLTITATVGNTAVNQNLTLVVQ